MQRFKAFLGDIDHLWKKTAGSDKEYVHPRLKNLGNISIVLIREAIAPVVFKNFEQEITDIEITLGSDPHVRAVPNKFKYPERGRGLQILRALKAGGDFPQNKTVLAGNPSKVFDLNSFVFGDSVQKPKVLPIKAAVNYSDALSVLPKYQCVEETDHVRSNETGTLWDEEKQENSSNLFKRHFIKPGTLMVQVLSTRHCLLPQIGLDHLLLCLGLGGTYGGQTSVTGINIRTHIVGIYGDIFEQAITSPYCLVQEIVNSDQDNQKLSCDLEALTAYLHDEHLSPAHQLSMNAKETGAYLQQLMDRFEQDNDALAAEYQAARKQIGTFFDEWFGITPETKGKKGRAKKTETKSQEMPEKNE